MKKYLLYFLLGVLGLSSCNNLEQDITINLPNVEKRLAVECYIENGKLPRLTLTETSGYFDSPALPIVATAEVKITSKKGTDLLRFAPAFNPFTFKGFTHEGSLPLNINVGDELSLEINDPTTGRKVSAKNKVLPPPAISEIRATFNKDSLAFLFLRFPDNDPNASNYYHLVINNDSLTGKVQTDFSFEGRFTTNNDVTIGTPFRFKANDTIIVTVFHIDKAYYDFLETAEDAVSANGNPFGQPAVLVSNIDNGVGIFTILSYDRRYFYIKPSGEIVYFTPK
ncbi:MAG: DUF4249 domain-containing protein [Cytophagales bacterium]|nr:MAG: DUF4249 domain-containing protein [Cytophagales bacterium]